MKVASLIVALTLALASGAPAQPAPLSGAAAAVVSAAPPAAGTIDAGSTSKGNGEPSPSAAPGPSTYVLLALGLFGMGLVSRRRQPD